MFDYLPEKLHAALSQVNYKKLYEVRLRIGQAVTVNIGGIMKYLTAYGVSSAFKDAITVSKSDLDYIVDRITKRSLYAYSDSIRRGFITTDIGERIGIAGGCVSEGGVITAIKNFTSLNIRIPHAVIGCANEICQQVFSDGLKNVLIFSKPGMGKTTLIRDIIRFLSEKNKYNMLVVDERNEIILDNSVYKGVDIMKNSTKSFCFENGIRSLCPDVIFTDELYGENDFLAVKRAMDSGVNVVASAHGVDARRFMPYVFDFYIRLDDFKVGKIAEVLKREREDYVSISKNV